MISYEQALALINQLDAITMTEDVSLDAAHNRVLGEAVTAHSPSPPFTNSAMDGFAVRHADLKTGQALLIRGEQRAGAPAPSLRVEAGSCVRIMTGAMLPEGADTIIPVEDVQKETSDGFVTFATNVSQGAFIRSQGQDLRLGEVVAHLGQKVTPELAALLAAVGVSTVKVVTQPKIGLLTTGDEVVDHREELQPGQIFNSAAVYLRAQLARYGLVPHGQTHVADTPRTEALDAAKEFFATHPGPKILITTGAVSKGVSDFIPALAQELGFEVLFHRVAIRPGKPVFLARRQQDLWLGLPGNIISTMVGMKFFFEPILARLMRLSDMPPRMTAILSHQCEKPPGLRCFYRARYHANHVTIEKDQGSAQLKANALTNAFVVLPEDWQTIAEGTLVETVLY